MQAKIFTANCIKGIPHRVTIKECLICPYVDKGRLLDKLLVYCTHPLEGDHNVE